MIVDVMSLSAYKKAAEEVAPKGRATNCSFLELFNTLSYGWCLKISLRSFYFLIIILYWFSLLIY